MNISSKFTNKKIFHVQQFLSKSVIFVRGKRTLHILATLFTTFFPQSDCLVFDTGIAQLFADNGNLGINVTISRVVMTWMTELSCLCFSTFSDYGQTMNVAAFHSKIYRYDAVRITQTGLSTAMSMSELPRPEGNYHLEWRTYPLYLPPVCLSLILSFYSLIFSLLPRSWSTCENHAPSLLQTSDDIFVDLYPNRIAVINVYKFGHMIDIFYTKEPHLLCLE